jgi:hypothetical protein
MTTADYCLESDLRCALELDKCNREGWAVSHIDFVRLVARQNWREIVRRKLQLELHICMQ